MLQSLEQSAKQAARAVFSLTTLLLLFSPISYADAATVEIKNTRSEKIKLCVYRNSHATWLRPLECWTVNKGKSVKWKRGSDKFTFKVRVFRPALIDKVLCEQKDLKNLVRLDVKDGSFCFEAFEGPPPSPPEPDKAGFEICNKTDLELYVAHGRRRDKIWTSEGWWKFDPNQCRNLIPGKLTNRHYYVYAKHYGSDQEWTGNHSFCVDLDAKFEIRGDENCDGRGYSKVGFFHVDTGEKRYYKVDLDPK